ncbi:hypothetical protein AAL_06301 [Moelleriella libera RCEF 2490]|uniref:DUF3835 domain-containing protein n=1 Tax=Moelleriella libera RCEF 2490 TaxID=1081109 RepID=A0A167Z2Z2_9HYPO|nr:hypothetical protein AAL_06301 [Moelleriella libera RCEF 2490]
MPGPTADARRSVPGLVVSTPQQLAAATAADRGARRATLAGVLPSYKRHLLAALLRPGELYQRKSSDGRKAILPSTKARSIRAFQNSLGAENMSSGEQDFSNVEKHRLQLELNVKQLREALQHWQTWDAEYEALKEEVEALPEPCTPDRLLRVKQDFDAELLVSKEIEEIFGLQDSKSKRQIINVLQRRIDYVGQNIVTLEKQLETAEARCDASVIANQSSGDEDGQKMTEIIEHLDDDGNVISSRLTQPGEALPKVQETLERAGVDGFSQKDNAFKEDPAKVSSSLQAQPSHLRDETRKSSAKETVTSPTLKKTVSFSEDVQRSEPPPEDMSKRAKRVDRIMKTAKEQESISKEAPVIPDDEDSDDAALRREMLKYGMGEVGAVVAELQLEDGEGTDDDAGYTDDDWDDDDDDDDDEEDRYGRFTGRVVTDKYRQRMVELEQKLGIKPPSAQESKDQGAAEDERIGRIVVKRSSEHTPSASRPAPSKSTLKDRNSNGVVDAKKGVRFAKALDIAPEDKTVAQSVSEEEWPAVNPLGEVVERTIDSPASTPARKPSRFKKAREGVTTEGTTSQAPLNSPSQHMLEQQETVPTGPEGSTIADELVEREPASHVAAPDEVDDRTTFRELADEHHRLRRKMIRKDGGGFLKGYDPITPPLDETGEPMSRFKAARLSRQ